MNFGDWLELPATAITQEMVRERKSLLLKSKKERTVNEALAILRALLYFAAKNYETPSGKPLIAANPVTCVSRFSESDVRKTFIPDSLLANWYQELMTTSWATSRDYLYFALVSGLRKMEAMTLEWRDVNFEDGTINIRAEVCKNGRTFSLPMSKHIRAFLQYRKQACGDSNYVFPGQSSKGRLRSCQRVTDEVGRKIGHRFTMDDLRRTFQNAGLQAGVSAHLLKMLNNTVSGRSTVELLQKPDLEELRAAMEKISRRLLAVMSVDSSNTGPGSLSNTG